MKIPLYRDEAEFEVMYATEDDEFFFEDSEELVPVGTAIGLDIDRGDEVELVLFDNIYWSPNWE
jgi:hypothetical protein